MSENSLKIVATVDNTKTSRENFFSAVSELANFIESSARSPIELESIDLKSEVFIEFFDGSNEEIEEILSFAEKLNLITHAELFLEATGETEFFKLFEGKALKLSSKKEYKEIIEDSVSLPTQSFDYGKERTNQTCLIRLRVKVAKKRKLILDTFLKYVGKKAINEQFFQEFKTDFEKLIKPKAKDEIAWCRVRRDWLPNDLEGPSELIRGLVFAEQVGTSLYLGFDLASVDLDFESVSIYSPAENQFNNLYYILDAIDGVSKVWFKIHPGTNLNYELYGCNPGMGESPTLFEEEISPEHFYRVYRG